MDDAYNLCDSPIKSTDIMPRIIASMAPPLSAAGSHI